MDGENEVRGLKLAVHEAGGQVKLARHLGVSQQAVSVWVRRGWVPLDRAPEIEAQFGVPRNDLVNPRISNTMTETTV